MGPFIRMGASHMAVSYELVDRRGGVLTAVCMGASDEPYVWRVEFWGAKGLRHIEPRMKIDPSASHKQMLQDFVTEHGLTATLYPSPGKTD